jgi:hypothetical protein
VYDPLLTVPTATFRVLCALFVLSLDRRRVVHCNVTSRASAEWAAQQIVDAFPEDQAPRYLLRDHDGVYGAAFTKRIAWHPRGQDRAAISLAESIRGALRALHSSRLPRLQDLQASVELGLVAWDGIKPPLRGFSVPPGEKIEEDGKG